MIQKTSEISCKAYAIIYLYVVSKLLKKTKKRKFYAISAPKQKK